MCMTYVPVEDTLVDRWVGIGLGVTAEFTRNGKTMKKKVGFTRFQFLLLVYCNFACVCSWLID